MNKLELILTKIILNTLYYFFCIFPVKKRKIVFATPRNDITQGNLKYIYDEIKSQKLDYHCILLWDKYGYKWVDKVKYLFLLILRMYHFATARFIIVDNAYLPVHIIHHRKETTVVQVWHACGAFKKFGLSTKDLEDGIRESEITFLHKNYDIAITSSKNIASCYCEAFNMKEHQILPLGVPRTDFFYDDAKMALKQQSIYKKFPQLKNHKVLLYAPTFRGRGKDKYIEIPFDIKKLKKALYPEYLLIIKGHPHAGFEDVIHYDPEFSTLIWNQFSLNALFTVSDILITDYSSGIFEFSLLNKPMIFYAYDLEEYKSKNAFYMEYESFVPGPIATTQEELLEILHKQTYKEYDIQGFAKNNFDYMDGKSTQRFIQEIILHNDDTTK
ncbi:MAG: CDP-glycerol glycerophosphotransferase family protein [Eubacteriales bacterium]